MACHVVGHGFDTGSNATVSQLNGARRYAEIGEVIRKYMGTKQSEDGAYRLKLFLALRDFAASGYAGHHAVSTIQAGGGLFAQRVVTRSRYDMAKARRMALEKSGLEEPWS